MTLPGAWLTSTKPLTLTPTKQSFGLGDLHCTYSRLIWWLHYKTVKASIGFLGKTSQKPIVLFCVIERAILKLPLLYSKRCSIRPITKVHRPKNG